MLDVRRLSHSSWMFCFCFGVLFCLSVREISIDIPSNSLILFLTVQSTDEPIKGIPHFCSSVSNLFHFLLMVSSRFHSLFTLAICPCKLSTFSIRAVDTSVVVVSPSRRIIPTCVSYLSLILMLALPLQTVFFLPFCLLLIWGWKLDMYQAIETEVKQAFAVGIYVGFIKSSTVFNVCIGPRGFDLV